MSFFSGRVKTINRRREPRYVLPSMVAYTEEGVDSREKLVNVSRSGCCIHSPVDFNKGEHVLVHFIASDNFYVIEDSFCLDGRVVWHETDKENGYLYGMEFENHDSGFFENESRSFKDHVARLACQSYLTSTTNNPSPAQPPKPEEK